MSDADIRRQLQSKIDEILSESNHAISESTKSRSSKKSRVVSSDFEDADTSETEIDKFNDPEEAFRRLLRLVDIQERSQLQMRNKLRQKGFSSFAIDAAIERAVKANIINDERFAEMLIASRVAQGRGFSGIERELKQNGIDPDSIKGWPYDFGFDENAEVERAVDLLQSKPPRSKNLRDGAYRKLANKGYSNSVCIKAIRIWIDHLEEN